MVSAWVITIPATGLLAFLIEKMTLLPGVSAWLAVGSLVFVAGGLIVYAMTHSIGAEDLEAEIPSEPELDTALPGTPHLEGHGPVDR
jgi:hypothetical protein